MSQKPKIRPPSGYFQKIRKTITNSNLKTVCQESKCPNQSECWSNGTATFLVLGDTCTRACKFCNTKTYHKGQLLDENEPKKLAEAAKEWGLKYVVITSVDRDDLPDGGSNHFAECIRSVKKHAKVEVLIPDFTGQNLEKIISAQPDVISHNVETVKRLTPKVRDPRASYQKSLQTLKEASKSEIPTKSSIILGIGETEEEVIETMKDLKLVGVKILAIGQYLQPSPKQLPVKEYIKEEKFNFFKKEAEKLGFEVASGPLVRTSYKAHEIFKKIQKPKK